MIKIIRRETISLKDCNKKHLYCAVHNDDCFHLITQCNSFGQETIVYNSILERVNGKSSFTELLRWYCTNDNWTLYCCNNLAEIVAVQQNKIKGQQMIKIVCEETISLSNCDLNHLHCAKSSSEFRLLTQGKEGIAIDARGHRQNSAKTYRELLEFYADSSGYTLYQCDTLADVVKVQQDNSKP